MLILCWPATIESLPTETNKRNVGHLFFVLFFAVGVLGAHQHTGWGDFWQRCLSPLTCIIFVIDKAQTCTVVAESGAARQKTDQLKILDSDFLSWNTRMINVRLCSSSKYYSLDIWSTIIWTESQRFSQQMRMYFVWMMLLLWKLRNVFLPVCHRTCGRVNSVYKKKCARGGQLCESGKEAPTS